VIVRVGYVDGQLVEGEPSRWQDWPGQGVDWVEVASGPGRTRLSGQSVYWLYREGEAWVMGGGPVGYGTLPPELVVTEERQDARAVRFMPDLPREAVKLGHWWRGTSEPVDG
jgi:hypothetical protein